MIRKKTMKCLSTVICTGIILSTLAGCTKSNTSNADAGKSGEVTKITVMTPLMGAQPPRMDGNPVLKKMEETTNTKLDVSFVPSGSYKDKLNVNMASNSLPMVTVVDGGLLRSSSIVKSANSGMFWDVEPFLKDYPNLKKFYNEPVVLDNCRINGKLYGLPRPRVLGRSGLIIRQDWLDNLGLKAPTTPQEVYEVAKAFTLNDPDKNGQADTIGLEYADISTGSYGWNGISTMTVAMGGFNTWGVQDGKVTPDFMTKEYMDTLKLLNTMYKEKLINQDFPLVTGNKRYDAFDQGKVGMLFCVIDDSGSNAEGNAEGMRQNLLKSVPTAKLSVVPALSGPKGQKVPATAGHNGMMMFSKTAVKTEADLKKILAFYDKMTTNEMIDLLTYGVEGVNYKVEGGVKKAIDTSKFKEDSAEFIMMLPRPGIVETPVDKPMTKQINATFKANEKFLVGSVAEALSSSTKDQVGGELDKLIFDARIKFVMGQIDEAGFNKVLENWKKQGGDKVIQEFTDAYNKTEKK